MAWTILPYKPTYIIPQFMLDNLCIATSNTSSKSISRTPQKDFTAGTMKRKENDLNHPPPANYAQNVHLPGVYASLLPSIQVILEWLKRVP